MSLPTTPVYDPRYRSLDHWRGIAALSVVFYHGFGTSEVLTHDLRPGVIWLRWLAGFGWFGVHLFFVISGYCIAANVYRCWRKSIGPGDFFLDRLLRIYPAYWAACLVAIGLNVVAAPFNHVPLRENLPRDWATAGANILLIEPYVGTQAFLLVSWTLVYELGFYVIVAFGFGLFRRGVNFWGLFAVAVLLGLVGLLGWNGGALHVLTFWPEFLCGATVFLALFLGGESSLLGRTFACLPLAFALFGAATLPFGLRQGQMVGAAVYATLLFVLRRWDRPIADWQPLHWLAWVGTFSYSLYLVHIPFGGKVLNLVLRRTTPGSSWVLPLNTLAWTLSVFLAYAFFRVCEQPLEKWRHGFQRRQIQAAAVPQDAHAT